jgi:hypothetical protein
MVSADDVERLSRLLAGDLSAAEETALRAELHQRPGLQQAFERLRALEAMTASLAPTRSDVALAQAAAERVRRAPARVAVLPVAAALVAGAALAAAVTAWLWLDPAPTPPPIVVNVPAPAPAPATSPVLRTPLGQLELLDGAEVAPLSSGVFRLEHGNVLATGKVSVEVQGHRVDIEGKVLVATEPERAERHVTAPVQRQPLAATAAMLFVMEGSAKVDAPAPPPVFEVPTARPNAALDPALRPAQLLNLREVNEAVVPRRQAIGRCFAEGLKGNPKLQGKVTLLLTLKSEDGRKSRLSEGTVAGDDSLQNPFVASCVLQALADVTFPAPNGADEVQLAYPLEFKPRNEGTVGTWVMLPDDGAEQRRAPMPDRAERPNVEIGDSPQTAPGAKVTVVEFSEFGGCSFCWVAEQYMSTLRSRYKGRVNFVFKHHPLKTHPHAEDFARAMVAAQQQGRFWEYHAQLYAHYNPDGDPLALARRLGLDLAQFQRSLEAQETAMAVLRDVAQAEALGAKGVPSYFVNGREVVDATPAGVAADLKQLIDEELKR